MSGRWKIAAVCMLQFLSAIACGLLQSCTGSTPTPRGHRFHAGEESIREVLATDSVSRYERLLDTMPEPTVKMKINHHGSYGTLFGDSNYIHWQEGVTSGITPLTDSRSHWQLKRPLEKLASCRDFYVEKLSHSVPYVVPEAAAMVHEIGRRFNDSLQSRGGGNYRIRITSVLRNPAGISRLKRRNVNAVDSSVHQLGTTVDISYARFAADPDVTVARSIDDLKGLLAEILLEMKKEGKCYLKYERKQPCFHITVRADAYHRN